jgi:hypothetical protein
MKLKALKKRAKEVGVDEAKLEDADDADDVKSTVIELVVESMRQQGCASERRGVHPTLAVELTSFRDL